ncbi:MAG: hypothetical protein JJT94_09780, partial [Bernardetiaceae bacterium]|nr:hypothetical protein [Bernardetiaceae bacterium]
SISTYAAFANNPMIFTDHLGDTLRLLGPISEVVLEYLRQGLGIDNQEDSPFFVDELNVVQINYDVYDNLSDEQQDIASNVREVIESAEIDFRFSIRKGSTVILNEKGKLKTIDDMGGAATISSPSLPNLVKIYLGNEKLKRKDQPKNTSNQVLPAPHFLRFYHEVGGHAYYRYIKKSEKQAGLSVVYENKIRKFLDKKLDNKKYDKRDFDIKHMNPEY